MLDLDGDAAAKKRHYHHRLDNDCPWTMRVFNGDLCGDDDDGKLYKQSGVPRGSRIAQGSTLHPAQGFNRSVGAKGRSHLGSRTSLDSLGGFQDSRCNRSTVAPDP